jgi:hypothetical protein
VAVGASEVKTPPEVNPVGSPSRLLSFPSVNANRSGGRPCGPEETAVPPPVLARSHLSSFLLPSHSHPERPEQPQRPSMAVDGGETALPWCPSPVHACGQSRARCRRAALRWCPFGQSPRARAAARLPFSILSPSPRGSVLSPARRRELLPVRRRWRRR